MAGCPPACITAHSYYDVELPISDGFGTVRLFAMDSDSFRTETSSRLAQETWLQQGLENSTATWNFVYMHHAPYSSASTHGSDPQMQLPFQQWGAHAVLAGHDHTYERLRVTDPTQNEMLYFVNGLGGNSLRGFGTPENGSEVRYNANFGASRITVTDQTATFEFQAPPENLWLDPGGPRRFQGIQGKKNVRQAT